MHRWFKTRKAIIVVPLLLALSFIIACGESATAVPAVKVAPAATAVPAVKVAPAATAVPQAQAKAMPAIRSIPPDPSAKSGGVLQTTSGTPGTWDVNQSPSSSVLGPIGPRLQGLIKMSPYDRGVTILPGLAEAWEISDDGRLITFHLRDGAKFHDGTTVTSDDVVATWVRIYAPNEGEISYRKDWFSRIEEVKAVDPSTVQFVFREASAEVLNFIASDWNAVFPKKVLEANANDLKTVIDHPSAGPFKFLEIKAGELIAYERFEDYWDEGFPYLDGIEFHLLGSGGFPAFLVGQIDTRQVNGPVDFQLALDRGILGERAMVPIVHAIYFNTSVKPFDDVRVRKAMDLAIDRDELQVARQDLVFPGVGKHRWAAPGSAFAQPESQLEALAVFNPDKGARLAQAKALLTEAGFPNGFEADMTVGSPVSLVAQAEYVQAIWSETLNINLDLQTLDWSVWIARAGKQQFGITSGAQFTTLHDPSDFMNTFWRSGGAQNWSGWSNAEFDSIMDKVDTELDPAKRKQFVFDAYAVLEKELPQMTGGWAMDGHMWWPYVKAFPSRGPEMGRYVFFDRQTLWLDK